MHTGVVMYSIKCNTATITSPDLTSPVNVNIIDVDGTRFFRPVKNDRKILRLLCPTCKPSDESRPMTKSTIIETIIDMRNRLFAERVSTTRKQMRYGVNTVRRQILELDDVTTIDLPSVGDISGITARVMFEPPSVKTVAIELTNEVLTYLSSVIAYQRERAVAQQQRRESVGGLAAGVTAVYKDGDIVKYRAQYKYNDNGTKRVRNAYFKTVDDDAGAVDMAREFTVNGCRATGSVPSLDEASCGSDDGDDRYASGVEHRDGDACAGGAVARTWDIFKSRKTTSVEHSIV